MLSREILSHRQALRLFVVLWLTTFSCIIPQTFGQDIPQDRRTEVNLAGPAGRRAVGGEGRYLVLTIPTLRQVAVYDVSLGKVVKYLPADDSDIHVAACKDRIFVLLATRRLISTYSFDSFERVRAATIDIAAPIVGISAGHSSSGPLVIASADTSFSTFETSLKFYDASQLQPIQVKYSQPSRQVFDSRTPMIIQAAADGKTILVVGRYLSLLRINGNEIEVTKSEIDHNSNAFRHACIGPRGQFVYSPKGIYNSLLQLISVLSDGNHFFDFRIPDVDGNFFLNLATGDLKTKAGSITPTISLHQAGSDTPLVELKNIDASEGDQSQTHYQKSPGYEHSLFLFSNFNALIQSPTNSERLIVHHIDTDQLVHDSGADYLYVRSVRPTLAQVGQGFEANVDAKTKAGGMKYQLASGPDGMTVDPNGLIRWNVPHDFSKDQAIAILKLTDRSSRQVFHPFHVTVEGHPSTAVEMVSALEEEHVTAPNGESSRNEPSATLTEAKVDLPEPYSDMKVGGSGAFLVMRFDKKKALGVVDVRQRKFLGYISLPDDQVHYAANAKSIVMASRSSGTISRYNISTLKQEFVRPYSGGFIGHMFMGSSSNGPFCIAETQMSPPDQAIYEYDLSTFEDTRVPFAGTGNRSIGATGRVRVSANGATLTVQKTRSPSGLQTFVRKADGWHAHYEHLSAGDLAPSADGNTIYSSKGIYTSDLRKTLEESGFRYSPATEGELYLRCLEMRLSPLRKPNDNNLTLHHLGSDQMLLQLPFSADGPISERPRGRWTPSLEQQVILSPQAHAIVLAPFGADHLTIKHFDVDDLLQSAGTDYLFVSSPSWRTAALDQLFEHQLKVKSKNGGVTIGLISAPNGMTLALDGKLVWQVPAKVTRQDEVVVMRVEDKLGTTREHKLTLKLIGADSQIAEQLAKEKMQADKAEVIRVTKLAEERARKKREWQEAQEAKTQAKPGSLSGAQLQKKTQPEFRTWTDPDGQTVEALFVRNFGTSVILQLHDGSLITIQAKYLSARDVLFMSEFKKQGERQ